MGWVPASPLSLTRPQVLVRGAAGPPLQEERGDRGRGDPAPACHWPALHAGPSPLRRSQPSRGLGTALWTPGPMAARAPRPAALPCLARARLLAHPPHSWGSPCFGHVGLRMPPALWACPRCQAGTLERVRLVEALPEHSLPHRSRSTSSSWWRGCTICTATGSSTWTSRYCPLWAPLEPGWQRGEPWACGPGRDRPTTSSLPAGPAVLRGPGALLPGGRSGGSAPTEQGSTQPAQSDLAPHPLSASRTLNDSLRPGNPRWPDPQRLPILSDSPPIS